MTVNICHRCVLWTVYCNPQILKTALKYNPRKIIEKFLRPVAIVAPTQSITASAWMRILQTNIYVTLQVCSALYKYFNRHFVFKSGNNCLHIFFPNCGLEVLNNSYSEYAILNSKGVPVSIFIFDCFNLRQKFVELHCLMTGLVATNRL